MKKIHEVRWLSRSDAVAAVVQGYDALRTFFEQDAAQENDPTAQGIHKHLWQEVNAFNTFN